MTRFRPPRLSSARVSPFLFAAIACVLAAALSGCASSRPGHRLAGVDLVDRPVAVVAAIPPSPRVQSGSPGDGALTPRDPLGSLARLGTAAAKWDAIERAQARLDSTARRLDVADRIARRAFSESARLIGFVPVGAPADADFLLDLRIYDYGLVADSYEGATFFALEAEVVLVDRAEGRELWRRKVREREVLESSVFGLPAAVGNVVTARALAGLSEDEMAAGLTRLADFTADRIARRLADDYSASKE